MSFLQYWISIIIYFQKNSHDTSLRYFAELLTNFHIVPYKFFTFAEQKKNIHRQSPASPAAELATPGGTPKATPGVKYWPW
jgi:hypothetical protein